MDTTSQVAASATAEHATLRAPAPTEAAPEAAIIYSHRQITRVVQGIVLCILLAALDQTVVIPAVPAIATELNGFSHLSWIVTAYLLTSTAATPIFGKLSDMWGRRALLLPAIVLFIIASALCASAQSLTWLIVCRALQGVGGGGLMSMAQAAIADVVSPRERGRYQGYMAGTWGIASIAGPLVGGYVTEHLSWRWVFWINLPLGLLALLACAQALRILQVRRRRTQIDYLGAALLTGGITAWLVLLSSGGTEFPWASLPGFALAGLGVLLILLLAWQERRAPEPLLPPRLFANDIFTRGVMLAFFSSLGLFAGTFLLPLYFQLARGVDPGQSGVIVVPFLLSSTVGAFLAGQLSRRLGRPRGIVLTGMLAAAGGFALVGTLSLHTPLVLAELYMTLLGFGMGLCLPSVLVMVQNAAERRDVGVATGSLLFLRSMGGAFGSAVGGALLTGHFLAHLATLGITAHVDLGAVHGGAAIAGVPDALRAAALQGLVGGFHLAFWVTSGLLLVGAAICATMRDVVLRTAVDPSEAGAEAGAIGH
jgi:EmrB/QacA subfamily drug resistance transporter